MNRFPARWLSWGVKTNLALSSFALLGLLAAAPSCSSSSSPAAPSAAAPGAPTRDPVKIDGAAAKALVAAGAQLIDVRSEGEYSGGHIDGATNIPIDRLADSLAQIKKDKPVIVYCAAGVRAGRAATLLANAGYDVRNLGSMSAWPQ